MNIVRIKLKLVKFKQMNQPRLCWHKVVFGKITLQTFMCLFVIRKINQ